MNIANEINQVIRTVASDDGPHQVILERGFATSSSDLWNACTNPTRLPNWFEPVRGDLSLGGRYMLTGSGTEGTIRRCEPPRHLTVSWEYQRDISHVDLEITASSEDHAVLRLTHHVPDGNHWSTYGPAAAGIGWEESLLALSLYFAGDPRATPEEMEAFASTPEGHELTRMAARRWSAAHKAAGEDAAVADAMAEQTANAYLGED